MKLIGKHFCYRNRLILNGNEVLAVQSISVFRAIIIFFPFTFASINFD